MATNDRRFWSLAMAVVEPVATAGNRFALPPDLHVEWVTSPECTRGQILAKSDPEMYGGEERLLAAMRSCAAEFVERVRRERLQGQPLASEELAEREKKIIPTPLAPEGYGYRVCSRCKGAKVEGLGQKCTCVLPVNGRPGYELFIIPMVREASR